MLGVIILHQDGLLGVCQCRENERNGTKVNEDRLFQSKGNDVFINYTNNLIWVFIVFSAFFGTTLSLVQVFQIGNLKRHLDSLERKLKSLEDA